MSLDVELALKENKGLDELVTVEEEGKFVVVRPKPWLGDDWHKVNDVLHLFDVEWIKLGKQSHWRIPLESIMKPKHEVGNARIPIEKAKGPIPLKQPQKPMPPMIEIYDPKILQQLERSKNQQGYLQVVKKDQYGNILSGKHRKKADPNWIEEKIEVQDELDRELKIVHFNVQRKVPIEENKLRFLRIAQLLEAKGIPPKDVCRHMSTLLPYSQRHIERLLPNRYKHIEKRPESNPIQPIVPYGDNMFYLSEKFQQSRKDSFFVVKEGEPYPTLGRRTWFFHEDGREFSLREYARVQEFPEEFLFVGTKDKIKDQIGNAVPPLMAKFIANKIPPSSSVSLFSGAGGMSLGFQEANHKILLATDWNRYCALTYQANFPNVNFILKDIKELTTDELRGKIDSEVQLVFAGPPCQGFSLAGRRFINDPRNEMYKEFLRFVEALKPNHFVMENVLGILPFKDHILEDMEKIGYKVSCELVKGEDIGMRQKRHRVFFVGEA